MTERIIALRPHHIDRFVSYYYNRGFFDKPSLLNGQTISNRYDKRFAQKSKGLFNFLASGGTGEEYILVRNGLDIICQTCPIKKGTCSDSDSLSLWNGSGYIMQEMDLREGFLYTLEEFLGKVKQLYPDRHLIGVGELVE